MSSASSSENDAEGDEEMAENKVPTDPSEEVSEDRRHDDEASETLEEQRMLEILEEERAGITTPTSMENGGLGKGYRNIQQDDHVSDLEDNQHMPRRKGSPAESVDSIPDDTPSIQGSVFSSPGSSVLPSMASRPGLSSPTPSFRPFDRRFQSRLTSSPLNSPRTPSPSLLSHSRQTSFSSKLAIGTEDTDAPSPPWEVVRWTKLKKLNNQTFSEAGKRKFGTPTCISVSASIVLGTSKGIILIFDYHQNLKSIIGLGTIAVECGAVTSIAISADHTTVAGGHANGSIFTWDTARSARPFLSIPPLESSHLRNRTADGHVANFAINHLGFLGTRHTALVSANDRGMAFSHLASRGTGALGRSVKTTRILGRYPNDKTVPGKQHKPSTVLAFAPLPLGNVEQGVDSLGLTAILTPYLLVIVSTTPVAQTEHKSARPKEVAAHSAMSGCLAWFPAVKLKVKDPTTGDLISKVKLVYCWSNVLTVLDVEEVESVEKDKPPSLFFKARSRWKAEEAIVAVQWLSRSVLTALTITQRLVILEDQTMRVTEGFDLLQKHIFRQDLFSRQLQTLIEQLDEEDPSMHGVVADAFYMSFKTYKGRMFLLGFNDVSTGTLSNWADRLIALMENGDYIGSIDLAASYYTGEAEKLTIGLPEDTSLRHSMVRDKLLEIMTASVKFAFSKGRVERSSQDDHLRALAEACYAASVAIGDIDFLFDEAYEWYEQGDAEGIFLETLEPYILDGQISSVPPTIVKSLVTHYVTNGLESRLEEMICHMETSTLDLDELTTLCKQHGLYDALIYVWNEALGDYITPLIDLLTLLIPLTQNGDYFSNGDATEDPNYGVNALKMFPYLSYTFTGRRYPTGQSLEAEDAFNAKAELYWFLFSGKSITWPKGNRTPFLTKPNSSEEPSFPYLHMILNFDAPSFLSALNEAFEDSFLNNTPDQSSNSATNGDMSEEYLFGLSIDRRYIVSILQEVMSPANFAVEDTIYLDMFIARNLPKFPQYLLLSGTSLHKFLTNLCNYPGEDIANDAQLSAEYLLSVYHPPDLASLVPLFKKAGFHRVLKSVYKADKQYARLLQAYFDDPEDQDAAFDCIADCLRPRSGLSKKQISEVCEVIKTHAKALVDLDTTRTARTIDAFAPSLHGDVLDSLESEPMRQYEYLEAILEPKNDGETEVRATPNSSFMDHYVQLMCRFNAGHVVDYIQAVESSDLHLEKVLPAMVSGGVIDAAVILMARDGQVQAAMDRLTNHLGFLETALLGLLSAGVQNSEQNSKENAASELLETLQKYTSVGIWLCQGQSKPSTRRATFLPSKRASSSKSSLLPEELLWLNLMDSTVRITQAVSTSLSELPGPEASSTGRSRSGQIDTGKLLTTLRTLVQRTFTALLTSTSSGSNVSFLRVLRAFLTRASISSPNLSDLRAVLSSIFSAYAYEESILSLSDRLLDKDLFLNVKEATDLRQRGWRPKGSICEGCRKRVWGPGTAGGVFKKWEEKQGLERSKREERRAALVGDDVTRGKAKAKAQVDSTDDSASGSEDARGKGKGNGVSSTADTDDDEEEGHGFKPAANGDEPGALIVLACRHIYHQTCLEAVQVEDISGDVVHDGREYRCPIDG
ncbi:MAG: Vacuolar protein sorting-associated protein 8 [Claussenomyces sp. TS43310]|nr:MAG: Vacuolar protein sorting-associated protein 8 [Claussenomyces sp. TS43310]